MTRPVEKVWNPLYVSAQVWSGKVSQSEVNNYIIRRNTMWNNTSVELKMKRRNGNHRLHKKYWMEQCLLCFSENFFNVVVDFFPCPTVTVNQDSRVIFW